MKLGIQYRDAPIDRTRVSKSDRTITLSFSSEAPVDRSFGREILDHKKQSVDLSRLNSAAPLLLGHNVDDQIGVVEEAGLDGKRGVARVRFGKSERAQEIFNDVVDGIRSNVSVGYRVRKMVREEAGDESNIYRVVDWCPLEISIVSVPADASVGVSRQDTSEAEVTVINIMQRMDEQTNENTLPPTEPDSPDIDVVREEARAMENKRRNEIDEIYRQLMKNRREPIKGLAELYARAKSSTMSPEEFSRGCVPLMSNAQPIRTPDYKPAFIGMNSREVERYSWSKALLGAAHNRFDGLEKEVSDEFTRKYGQTPRGNFWVPPDVLWERGQTWERDLTVGTAGTGTAGGTLVATQLLSASFIELLRNRMVVARMGATIMDGLVGNVAIPSQTGAVTAQWVAETGTASEYNSTFSQVTMSPKGCTAIQDFSKLLLMQSSPAIDGIVKQDLATVLALAQDRAAMIGSGSSNEPTGIWSTSGVTLLTTSAVASWSTIVELETKVAEDNADYGALGYITNSTNRGRLKQAEKAFGSGSYVWEDGTTPEMGRMNGYPAASTNQLPATCTTPAGALTGGTGSPIIFGNWSDVVIGQWGGLDVLVDPYTMATTRIIRVVTTLYTDICVRHASSFKRYVFTG